MKRCIGAKVGGQEVQQGKSVVSQGKNREKTGSSQQPASERVVVENNALSVGSDLGFWLGNTPGCDTACKTNIAKGVAEGNLIASAGVGVAAGGAMIVAATPEIAAPLKLHGRM